MKRTAIFLTSAFALALVAGACGGGSSTTTPPTAPTASADPYAAYYNVPPGTAPPPGYPPQGYPPPGTAPQPTAPAPVAGPMAVPGPFALPCQNDAACILARCNTQYQKCAYPCQSAADCATGASCNAGSGLCLPGGQ